jgi:hypothetical protein
MQFDVTLKASFGDCFAFSHSKLQTKENEELCPKKCKGVVLRSSRTIAKSECIIVFSQVVVSICKRRRRRVVAKEASKQTLSQASWILFGEINSSLCSLDVAIQWFIQQNPQIMKCG